MPVKPIFRMGYIHVEDRLFDRLLNIITIISNIVNIIMFIILIINMFGGIRIASRH